MFGVRVKIEREPAPVWVDLPRFGRKLIISAAILSLLIHIFSLISASRFFDLTADQSRQSEGVRIKVNSAPSSSDKDLLGKKVLETPLEETKPPKESEFVGPQDHVAQKETKIAKKKMLEDKALDAGQKGKKTINELVQSSKAAKQNISGPGTLVIPGTQFVPRNNYEKLLPSKEVDVFGSPTAGHMEYIDANIPEGDRLDMNTTSFRYISYFTGMRKAIELVWIYPREALERGLQGEVQLEIVIEKDGQVSRIRVLHSSGFVVLDENMVKTIKEASPFAPLPKSWNKERILVTGAFHYILAYGAH